MKWKCVKKNYITLLEIMIVIFLIGLISAVVGYNMKGSLDKGREFKTSQAMEQIKNILLLEIEEGCSFTDLQKDAEKILKDSNLAKDPKALLKDGWNQNFIITYKDGDVIVKSEKYEEILKKKKNQRKKKSEKNVEVEVEVEEEEEGF